MAAKPVALCIGQSPLQVLNLVEALRADGADGRFLVVYDSEDVRAQIASLLERLGVREVRFQRRHLAFRLLHPLYLAPTWWRLRGRAATAYFGTYTSWASFLVNVVGAPRSVLVDDGQKTINILQAPELVGLAGRDMPWPWSRRFVRDAELYTFYDELAASRGRVARPNRLASVSAQLMGSSVEARPAGPDDILFIGTHLQDGYEPFERDLERVLREAGGRRVVYLMHRRDDAGRMRELGRRLGFEPLRFDLPLELVFHRLWSQEKPQTWTFGTTATDTLQAMHPELEVRVHRLDPAGFRSARTGAAFESIYAHYATRPRTTLVPRPS